MAKKITELTAATSLTTTDFVPAVTNTLSTPLTQKITFANMVASIVAAIFPLSTAGAVNGAAITGLASLPAGAGVIPAANLPVAASITRGTFVNGDLVAGVLTITHGKALASPYTVQVSVFNNTPTQIIPDAVNTLATNSFKVDLTSYGALTGTWSYAYST